VTAILATTFQPAMARLTNDEQKLVKQTVFDLQIDPTMPGLQMHRVDKARSDNIWSVRVGRDVRIIVQKAGSDIILAYVDHHDNAYDWAERRRIEAHPTTGALQIVEVRELVETVAPVAAAAIVEETSPKLFDRLDQQSLLSIGVPVDWLDDVLAATEDRFYELAPHLPEEARESLLEYAATGQLKAPPPLAAEADPLQHPDTQRRFRIMDGIEEMRAALDAPFEKWAVFLHPSQRETVERVHTGPARVAGSAGTGKTVVALHRVMRLLQNNPDARILLTTFSDPLSRALQQKLTLMAGGRSDLISRVRVGSFLQVAKELHTLGVGRAPVLAAAQAIRTQLSKAAMDQDVTEVSSQFLQSEWDNVIDAWQIASLAEYAEVPRIGRKSRLGPKQRERLWGVFAAVKDYLRSRNLLTESGVFAAVSAYYSGIAPQPFTHIVVDEAQDLGVPELRFLSAISSGEPDALFFAGDLGQRIFRQPFSWMRLGVDVRGRSATLKVNYRTSHQIRRAADRLLPTTVKDVDGLVDDRSGTVSVFDGPEPEVLVLADAAEEGRSVGAILADAVANGLSPAEIGVFVRSEAQLSRARTAVRNAGLTPRDLTDNGPASKDGVLVGTMHLAKGLEFRMVLLMACDADVLPLSERVQQVADEFELDEVLTTERQLLYVAATRARDRLVITASQPASELLDDLLMG
jgi:hypothetical protein